MKTCLLILMAVMGFGLVNAQTWQWGQRGGTSSNSSSKGSSEEAVTDMATDRNGNVYFISALTAGSNATLGNIPRGVYTAGGYAPENIIIVSYSCTGVLRWTKVIGGTADCDGRSIRVDTFGHVYVMGHVDVIQSVQTYGLAIHFDTDTTLPKDLFKRLFIVQYDTSGNYKWLRMPEVDTLMPGGAYGITRGYDMELDGAGNLNLLAFLSKNSLPNTSSTITSNGLYVVKYNPQGTVLSATKPSGFNFAVSTGWPMWSRAGEPDVQFESFRMARLMNGNWVIAGTQYDAVMYPGFSINGNRIGYPLFVASFNSQWQYLWYHVADTTGSSIVCRPVGDAASSVYLTGGDFFHYGKLFGVPLPVLARGSIPFVAKLDTSGVAQWMSFASDIRIASGCSASTYGEGITLTPGGEVLITGGCGGLKWGTKQIAGECNTGYTTFVGRFNTTTGTCNGLDTIAKLAAGSGNFGTTLATGKGNTVYLGGKTAGFQIAGPDTIIYAGGSDDFFIAKYGYPCNCTTLPTASFNSIATGKTLKFTYTGTTSNIDSVVWSWGDGQQQTVKSGYTTPLSHTYTGGGAYTACANVYGSCGSSSYCKETALGVNGMAAFKDVSIYPNPAATYFTVEGASGATITLSNAVGQMVKNFILTTDKEMLDISELAAGVYVLQLRDRTGNRGVMPLIKN
ncbi:MAG: T9SS type A sorting domain-containing protein [Chitinophagaceae bacterium]